MKKNVLLCFVKIVNFSGVHLALKQLCLGCHVGPTFAGAFGYVYDVALIALSLYALKKMISVCESYAERYHIAFNPTKSKLICYNIDPSTLGPICLNKQLISIVDNDKHLGNYISNDIHDRNIVSSVCDLYQRSNSTISDFNACNSDTLQARVQEFVRGGGAQNLSFFLAFQFFRGGGPSSEIGEKIIFSTKKVAKFR